MIGLPVSTSCGLTGYQRHLSDNQPPILGNRGIDRFILAFPGPPYPSAFVTRYPLICMYGMSAFPMGSVRGAPSNGRPYRTRCGNLRCRACAAPLPPTIAPPQQTLRFSSVPPAGSLQTIGSSAGVIG
jgi:hypothetical protein